jgi:hypothetical protein
LKEVGTRPGLGRFNFLKIEGINALKPSFDYGEKT